MLFYLVLVTNKDFCRAEVFSEILTNLSKYKLDIIKLSKLKNTRNTFDNLVLIFPKGVFPVQSRKNQYHHRIPHIWKVYEPNFTLYKQIFIFRPNFPKKGNSILKQKTWTSQSNSAYSNYTRCQVSTYTNNFDFSGQNFPKKGISSVKWKRFTSPSNFAYSN